MFPQGFTCPVVLIDIQFSLHFAYRIITFFDPASQLIRLYKLFLTYRDWETDRKSTRLNSSHSAKSRMPSSA